MTKYRGIHPPRNGSLADKLAWFSIPEPNSGCLLWFGAVTSEGVKGGDHGIARWKGRHEKAHRLAWLASNGPIPEGMNVLHRCDVPACVNPAHLYLGTLKQNTADMLARNRRAPKLGSNSPSAKLTEAQVREIRAATGTHASLARKYGVTPEMISIIRRRLAWTHI